MQWSKPSAELMASGEEDWNTKQGIRINIGHMFGAGEHTELKTVSLLGYGFIRYYYTASHRNRTQVLHKPEHFATPRPPSSPAKTCQRRISSNKKHAHSSYSERCTNRDWSHCSKSIRRSGMRSCSITPRSLFLRNIRRCRACNPPYCRERCDKSWNPLWPFP